MLYILYCSYDELVIGAPMNTDFDARMIKVERGRVYVFMNTGVSQSCSLTLTLSLSLSFSLSDSLSFC